MAPRISYPEVYVKEISSGIKPIRAAQTSIAGMVGTFSQGPIHVAKRIRNWKAFPPIFDNGGAPLWVVRTDPKNSNTLSAL